MAQLPLYYKNSKATGPKSTTKRWKEYYLLVITIVGFIILIAGVLWFVPGMEEDKSYNRAYNSFTALGGDFKVEATGHPSPLSDILRRDMEDPRGRKLEEKVSVPEPSIEEDKHPPKEREDTPVEKEDSEEAVPGQVVSEKAQVEVNDQIQNNNDQEESAETKERREKVVNVSLAFCLLACF